jgi:hypothetical protein
MTMTQVRFSTKLLSKLFCNFSRIVMQILVPHSAIETMTQNLVRQYSEILIGKMLLHHQLYGM